MMAQSAAVAGAGGQTTAIRLNLRPHQFIEKSSLRSHSCFVCGTGDQVVYMYVSRALLYMKLT